MPVTPSPLRYPGGKTRLSPFLRKLIAKNRLDECHYVEPYAGGAGLAISLLTKGNVTHLHLNDIDTSVYAFWHTVLNEPATLCDYIENVTVDMDEWERQKEIQEKKDVADLVSLGISTLFLNRTNRSGIISGGVIGGKKQSGKYKIDARFNRKTLTKKIELINFYKFRISVYNQDALKFIQNQIPNLPEKTLVNLDPPYYQKGQTLYKNSYELSDHCEISKAVPKLKQYWMVTYDNVEEIRKLYNGFNQISYNLSYTAQKKYAGKELLITDPRLILPKDSL